MSTSVCSVPRGRPADAPTNLSRYPSGLSCDKLLTIRCAARSVASTVSAISRSRCSGSFAMESKTWAWFVKNVQRPFPSATVASLFRIGVPRFERLNSFRSLRSRKSLASLAIFSAEPAVPTRTARYPSPDDTSASADRAAPSLERYTRSALRISSGRSVRFATTMPVPSTR
jgi:hypothetical protein